MYEPICRLGGDDVASKFWALDDGMEEMNRSSWAVGEVDVPVQRRFGDAAERFACEDERCQSSRRDCFDNFNKYFPRKLVVNVRGWFLPPGFQPFVHRDEWLDLHIRTQRNSPEFHDRIDLAFRPLGLVKKRK